MSGALTSAFSYFIASEEYMTYRDSVGAGGQGTMEQLSPDMFGIFAAPVSANFDTSASNLAVLPPTAATGAGMPVNTQSIGLVNSHLFVNGTAAIAGTGSYYARPADGSVLLRSASLSLRPGGA